MPQSRNYSEVPVKSVCLDFVHNVLNFFQVFFFSKEGVASLPTTTSNSTPVVVQRRLFNLEACFALTLLRFQGNNYHQWAVTIATLILLINDICCVKVIQSCFCPCREDVRLYTMPLPLVQTESSNFFSRKRRMRVSQQG